MSIVSKIRKRRVRNNLQVKSSNKSKSSILSVFRSNKNITAQLLSLDGNVLAVATSSSKVNKEKLLKENGVNIAGAIGEEIAKKAIAKGVKNVVFNKGPYMYIGRVKALAESARKAGLNF
jgi:large subunit ribosomal protein L18